MAATLTLTKGLSARGGRVVDGLGQQFLAGAGFAGQQHRHALPRRPAGKFLGPRDAGGLADIIVEGEAGARASCDNCRFAHPQVAFELAHPRDQRLEAVEMIVEHEADGADDVLVLVLDRHPRDDELLAAELHDVEQDRLAGLRHAAHQAVGDDLLDLTTEGLRGVTEAQRGKIFFVDIDDASGAIDRDGAFAEALQPLEQRLHGAGANEVGVADDGLAIGHGADKALR